MGGDGMSERRKIEWDDLSDEVREIINSLERRLDTAERRVDRLRAGLAVTIEASEPDDG